MVNEYIDMYFYNKVGVANIRYQIIDILYLIYNIQLLYHWRGYIVLTMLSIAYMLQWYKKYIVNI